MQNSGPSKTTRWLFGLLIGSMVPLMLAGVGVAWSVHGQVSKNSTRLLHVEGEKAALRDARERLVSVEEKVLANSKKLDVQRVILEDIRRSVR